MPSVSNHLSEGMGHQTLSAATNITQAWQRPAAIGIHSSKIQTFLCTSASVCTLCHMLQFGLDIKRGASYRSAITRPVAAAGPGLPGPQAAPFGSFLTISFRQLKVCHHGYNHAWKTCIIRIIIPCNPHRTLYHHETVWLSFASTIWD